MKVVLTGATGVIGSALAGALLERGDQVVVLSRDAERARAKLSGAEAHTWADPLEEPPPAAALEGADAVIHLLGENVAQRWSTATKRMIRESRVLATSNLVAAMRDSGDSPGVLVSGSATGFYGPRGDEPVDESEPFAPGDFLAEVCHDWERAAGRATDHGVRVVTARTGVVLSPSGGALEKMLPFFKLGVGGPVAGGRQYVPWIHLDDQVGALLHCLDSAEAKGPVNLTAPRPVTNRELSKELGRVLHRPAFAPVPGLAIKALYGEMASIVTGGVRAVPSRLQSLGYRFIRPDLGDALRQSVA